MSRIKKSNTKNHGQAFRLPANKKYPFYVKTFTATEFSAGV